MLRAAVPNKPMVLTAAGTLSVASPRMAPLR